MDILYAAKKYDVPGLESKCCQYVAECLNESNVCGLLNQAKVLGAEELVHQCVRLISQRTDAVLKSDVFLQLSQESLQALLGADMMGMKEEDVYTACKTWAIETCKRNGKDPANSKTLRETLGGCLNNVRFPTLSIDTFVKVVVKDNLLTPEEKLSVIQDIVLKEKMSKYPQECRKESKFREFSIETFKNTSSSAESMGKPDGVSFTVSKTVVMVAVGLYRPSNEGGMIEGVIEIFENETLMLSQNVRLLYEYYDGKIKYFKLDKEIYLSTKSIYSVRHKLVGSRAYFGINKKEIESSNGVIFKFQTLLDGLLEKFETTRCQVCGFKVKNYE